MASSMDVIPLHPCHDIWCYDDSDHACHGNDPWECRRWFGRKPTTTDHPPTPPTT